MKDEKERINEIALFQPLAQKTSFDESSKPIHQRKWSYTHKLPFMRRLSLKVQSFLFKKIRFLIPTERLTCEAKFKTVLAILLAQEPLREFFFSNDKRRENFFRAAQEAALAIGYSDFSLPTGTNPIKISQNLTLITGKKESLIDDLPELNLQMAALGYQESNEILFRILNQVERPPITSILEVMRGSEIEKISLTTRYAKYKIHGIDPQTGKIRYRYREDEATSSIRTRANSLPGVKGVMNQRRVLDSETGEWIGSYSGSLSMENNILEQTLFILNIKEQEVYLLDSAPQAEETTILLTSLFSWHEMSFILDQHKAVRNLNKKVLQIGGNRYIRLNLLHMNISFNAFNKFPIPSEMGAMIRDVNDQGQIALFSELWKKVGLFSPKLAALKEQLDVIAYEQEFLKHQERLLKTIDSFREIKQELAVQLEKAPKEEHTRAGLALLIGKKSNGKALRGIDMLLYLNILVNYLGYRHNKNCQNSTDRSAGANAADKAQHAYKKIRGSTFLPEIADEEELSLFKVLYSMYLVWEEPELNAALSTGFVGEKFYQNFFQRNPETTYYLINWLKEHPEMYIGLSDQRN
ncbi:MAG: hypothetical protein JJU12_03780 [Chlamydiales bacterium]|nr:hypothetical protein [Chlamydiales bacterium]